MMFKLCVGGVDGETSTFIATPSAGLAMHFLKDNDHEGSSIGLTIEIENPEEVYRTLELLIMARKQ